MPSIVRKHCLLYPSEQTRALRRDASSAEGRSSGGPSPGRVAAESE